ncbi:MAG: pyridine nucleotide-disulfide oxidoreductase, partial [Acidobacteriaceae bacterium]
MQRFARALNRAFIMRPELKSLAQPNTIVCRCEDVTHHQLRACTSWRQAKLHTRCGMGPCQGRICGPATEFLYGWKPSSVRPPIFPARISTLAQGANP